MTVDRGGLRYRITVEDAFTEGLTDFRQRIRSAREEWRQFKTELSTGGSSKGIKDAAKSVETAARAERRLADERRKGRREATAKETAERNYSRAVFRGAVAREEARIAEEKSYRLDRRILTTQQLRRKAENDIANVVNRRNIIEQRLLAVKAAGIKLSEKETVQLGLASRATIRLTAEQKRLQQVKDRLAAAQARQSNEQLLKLEAQKRAIDKITAARLKQLTVEELSRRGFTPSGTPVTAPEAPAQQRRTLSFFETLKRRVDAADKSGNRISFTFRRLFGILAAFAAARIAVQVFRDFVVQTVRLNAELETAELGIASLIGSVADVRDAQGNAASATERLAIASGEARKQVRLLRLDALTTTATFQELVQTFQNALAPGLRAGLDVDQIRAFSRQISIAATAIGLEQRQLAEEVRSLLSGTIRPQNTRIATFLGITNQDVRAAQEAGTLFEFLTERFEVFDVAGSRAAQTFVGLVQRVKDGFQIIGQTGGFVFFESLKDLLDDVFNSLIEIDAVTRQIQPNSELVNVVALIGEGLSFAVVEARRLASALSVDDLRDIAAGFRGLAQFAVSLLGGAIEGIVKGLRDAANLIRSIQSAVQNLTGIDLLDPEVLREVVVQITRILTLLTTIGLVMSTLTLVSRGLTLTISTVAGSIGAIRKALLSLIVPVKALNTSFKGMLATSKLLLVSLLKIAAVIVVALGAFTLGTTLYEEFKLVQIAAARLIAFLEKGWEDVRSTFDIFVAGAKAGWFLLFDEIRKPFGSFIEDFGRGMQEIEKLVEGTIFEFNLGASDVIKFGQDLQKAPPERESLSDAFTRIDRQTLEKQREIDAALEETIRQIEEQFANQGDESSESFLDAFLDNLKGNVRKISDALVDVVSTEDLTGNLGEQFDDEVNGIILRSSQSLLDLRSEFDALRTTINRSQGSATIAQRVLDVEQTIAQVIRERGEAELEAREKTLKVTEEIQQRENDISVLRRRLAAGEFSSDQAEQIEATIRAIGSQVDVLRAERARLTSVLQSAAAVRSIAPLQQANLEQSRENALLRIEAIQSRLITQAELEGNTRVAALERTRLELERINVEQQQAEQSFRATNAQILRELATSARLTFQALNDPGLTPEQKAERVRAETELSKQLALQLFSLGQHRDLQNEILEQERQRLLVQEQINAAAVEAPIGTGILQAFVESFNQVSDRFQTTLEIMRSAIQGFSQFVAQSLVDAFDPSANSSIQERFGRFLQSLATQIIATLVQLAITAIALNAASGGLLGPLLQSLARAQAPAGGFGLAEGGDVGEEARKHRRKRPLWRGRGFSVGGTPGERQVHGVDRPGGLHPSDTIPAWLSPKEWVVRASSVARAGRDAMDRINRGLFDPHRLREAVGLRAGRARMSKVATIKGPGYATGGEAVGSRRRPGDGGPGAMAGGFPAAVMAPSMDAMDRMTRAGGDALLRFLASNGITPSA